MYFVEEKRFFQKTAIVDKILKFRDMLPII